MKLRQIIGAGQAIRKVYEATPVIEGADFLKLRKQMKALTSELTTFEEAQNAKIKATGKTALKADDPDLPGVLKFIEEMLDSDTDIKVEPVLTVENLAAMKLSLADMDSLEKLGIVKPE